MGSEMCIRDSYMKLDAKPCELVQLMPKFVPRSHIGIFRNERTQSTTSVPKLTFWCVSYYLGAFGIIWLPYRTRCKRAELVQKFVPRSCVGIFRYERNRSTPLDPKLMFWSVSYYLGAFGIIWLPYETRCKTGRTNAKVRASKSRQNFSQRMHPIHPLDPKLTFWCVSYYLGHSGPFGCLTKLGAERAELVQKFVSRSRVGIFRNKRTRSNPLDSELTFWCISYYLGEFGTIWLPYETQCKTGRTSAKVRVTNSRQSFSQ